MESLILRRKGCEKNPIYLRNQGLSTSAYQVRSALNREQKQSGKRKDARRDFQRGPGQQTLQEKKRTTNTEEA